MQPALLVVVCGPAKAEIQKTTLSKRSLKIIADDVKVELVDLSHCTQRHELVAKIGKSADEAVQRKALNCHDSIGHTDSRQTSKPSIAFTRQCRAPSPTVASETLTSLHRRRIELTDNNCWAIN